jgi:hypothetical protein
MSILLLGSYVTHGKLPELGSGEVLASTDGRVCIRFASGERNFVYELVAKHLTVTTEAPVRSTAKASRKKAAKKA